MKAAADVDYREDGAVAGCVTFRAWTDEVPEEELTTRVPDTEPYEPGAFFRREMPCLLDVLALLDRTPEVVLVDGHVWLDGGRPGLGAHLREALGGRPAVVGVAKNPFAESTARVVPVQRGDSRRPLYVSAAGIPLEEAIHAVRSMHGNHRIPTLLRRVDRLCRTVP